MEATKYQPAAVEEPPVYNQTTVEISGNTNLQIEFFYFKIKTYFKQKRGATKI
jgi:hypothetical protein